MPHLLNMLPIADTFSAALRFAQADPVAPGAVGQAAKIAAEGGQVAADSGGGGGAMLQIAMMIGIFAVFWFLILRPQQKRTKEHKDFLGTLKIGAQVVTNSGLFGKIIKIDDKTLELQIAPKVNVKMLKSQIAGLEGNAQQAVESQQPR